MTVSFLQSMTDEPLPTSGYQEGGSAVCSPAPTSPALHRLTDLEREAAIKRAGELILKHHKTWLDTGSFAAKGMADYARQCMEKLIRGRSSEQVKRLEQERGLS